MSTPAPDAPDASLTPEPSPTPPSPAPPPARAFREVGAAMLESLAQHRVLSTSQVHALHTPTSTLRWTRQLLAELRDAGLAQAIRARRRPPEQLWFCTPGGHDALAGSPRAERRRVEVTPEAAAGVLQAHTSAVNECGLAFVRGAREHDDECGALAWRHEVAHPLNPAAAEGRRAGEYLVADAVLRYTRFAPDGGVDLLTWFVELDRATMPLEELVEKLRRYARLATFTPQGATGPAWQRLYTRTLPAVLLVLAGGERPALERRRGSVLALAADDPSIAGAQDLRVRVALLEDLTTDGPWSDVFVDLADPGRYVDATGTTP